MGSYMDADGLLPWLTAADIAAARAINEDMTAALRKKYGAGGYKGVVYGQFMCTKNGIDVIEFNARFGDPEAPRPSPLLPSPLCAYPRPNAKRHTPESK